MLQTSTRRLATIENARRAVMLEGASAAAARGIESWIANSWQRCLQRGQHPHDGVGFDVVSAAAMRRRTEASHALHSAAAPVMADLSRVIAPTGYFSILTDALGVVIDVGGTPDFTLPPVRAIARIGVDLSERSVGTTAIGAALTELQPVWLHRGEHFFDATSVYSCAGAPIFGPDGTCAGMLDLTGVQAEERPGLRHLVAQMAQRIEYALLLALPHRHLLQLQWPGLQPSNVTAVLAVDGDGRIVGASRSACAMLGLEGGRPAAGFGVLEDVFATAGGNLMSLRPGRAPLQVPLWSGLQVTVAGLPGRPGAIAGPPSPLPTASRLLRDTEAGLILDAVDAHHGNVAAAARQLGISRATVYRRLKRGPRR